MGGGSWEAEKWNHYRTRSGIDTARNVRDIYKSSEVQNKYLPKNITRESCDSEEHPSSHPIAIGLDVTGSMGHIVSAIAKKLGFLVGEIYEKKPVSDPQILFAAIDDYYSTSTPLQVTQFESDIRIAEQLTDLKFINRGGGNNFESYPLLWYFCLNHTKLDCITKRKEKAFIFTIGDDGFPDVLSKKEIYDVFGDEIADDISISNLVNDVSKNFEIFHFCLKEGNSYRVSDYHKWQRLLGNHAIKVSDYNKLPEIIVSLLELSTGVDIDTILSQWDKSTSKIVQESIMNVSFDTSIESLKTKEVILFD